MIVLVVAMGVLVFLFLRPRLLAQPPAVLGRLPLLAPVPASALAPPAPWRATAARPAPAWAATLALGTAEARRLLRSPLYVAALVLAVLNVQLLGERSEFATFNAFANGGPAALWCGLVCFFAGNLAATRRRREDTEELLGPVPLPPRRQALAYAVAAVAAGAGIFVVLLAGEVYWYDVRDLPYLRPTVWHLLATPVQVVGGVVLGVMVGTWAPWRGVAAAVFVALVGTHIGLANTGNEAWGAFLEFAKWPDQGGGFREESAMWHTLYLALLSAMAVVGTLVWLPGPRRALLAGGALVTLAAAGAGLAQFP